MSAGFRRRAARFNVHDALAYAHDHLGEIEADLAADDEATVKARHAGGPPAP